MILSVNVKYTPYLYTINLSLQTYAKEYLRILIKKKNLIKITFYKVYINTLYTIYKYIQK